MNQLPQAVPAATAAQADAPAFPGWLSHHMQACNTDFEQRIVQLPEYARWQKTDIAGIELRVMEFVPGDQPRLSAQLRFDPQHHAVALGNLANLEILIQRGNFESARGQQTEGMYFRLPETHHRYLQGLNFHSKTVKGRQYPALVYIASGHMLESDTESRQIDTHDKTRWLPGPIEGTQVLPLHGHGTGNIMMIAWTGTSAFKPRIDPRGEEVLVLHGALYDAKGYYPAGTWIRNPIVTWQSWGAKAGTVIYYKNGHFAHSIA